jgi:THO complex subunit 2
MDVDVIPTAPKEGRTHPQQEPASSRFGARQPSTPGQSSLLPMSVDIRAPAPREALKPSRLTALSPREPLSPRQRIEDKQIQEVMPPPTAPSQTLSAQELRETAKQTIGHRASEKFDDRRAVGDTRSQPGSGAPSPLPRRRTASPGTRNHSLESRTSGERRSDRGTADVDHGDGRVLERETRQELRLSRKESSAAHGLRSERVSSHRASARESDRDRESDRERDRDRGRDRHTERERDRERDKERDREREKDKDRERRDRDRERDRDRDRDRDRHRRDDKDRDRESRKDRDRSSQVLAPAASSATPEPRSLPTRPDPARHRPAAQVGDDALGKRRRLVDDDVSVLLWLMRLSDLLTG